MIKNKDNGPTVRLHYLSDTILQTSSLHVLPVIGSQFSRQPNAADVGSCNDNDDGSFFFPTKSAAPPQTSLPQRRTPLPFQASHRIRFFLPPPNYSVPPWRCKESSGSEIRTTITHSAGKDENSCPVAEKAGGNLGTDLPGNVEGTVQQKRAAKIHDFCFGIPFGGLVFSGGLIGFLFSRNPTTLTTGLVCGGSLLALAVTSLKVWRQGGSSLPFILGQAVLAAALLRKDFQEYSLVSQSNALHGQELHRSQNNAKTLDLPSRTCSRRGFANDYSGYPRLQAKVTKLSTTTSFLYTPSPNHLIDSDIHLLDLASSILAAQLPNLLHVFDLNLNGAPPFPEPNISPGP
ncbi:hypothetical protein ACLOJK_010424 [Asimina triloba]